MRMMLAIRAFWATLVNAEIAARLESLLSPEAPDRSTTALAESQMLDAPGAVGNGGGQRSEAVTLLAALQREARFVDLVSEPLSDYNDAQIGAAARDVLRDCNGVLERMFALKPLLSNEEGEEVEVDEGFEPGRYKLTGNISGQPPFRGRLVHHGWEATRCDLPRWSGSEDAVRVVSSAEVDLS